MRYIPQKSPLIDKYYIWDTVEKKITTEVGFDIIVDIRHHINLVIITTQHISINL